MTERPLIFSSESVLGILERRKTQTRRLSGLENANRYDGRLEGTLGDIPLGYRGLCPSEYYVRNKADYRENPELYHWFLGLDSRNNDLNPIIVKCPYGKIGDRLWCREKWMPDPPQDDTWDYYLYTDGAVVNFSALPDKFKNPKHVIYQASWDGPNLRWRSPIFMPRWASRITLEIVNIRAERVQEISSADAVCEGWPGPEAARITALKVPNTISGNAAVEWYIQTWDAINSKRGYGWEVNPWVWKIVFRRIS